MLVIVPICFMMSGCKEDVVATVCFEANGGEGTMPNQGVEMGVSRISTCTFTKIGCKFTGWNTKADGTGKSFTDRQLLPLYVVEKGHKLILYAQWTKCDNLANVTFTVSFNSEGGTKIEDQKLSAGENIKKPANPTKTGYVFGDWYLNEKFENAFNFSTPIFSNVELYASWKAADDTTVTTNSPDASAGNTTVGSAAEPTKTWHEAVTEPVYTDVPVYADAQVVKWQYAFQINKYMHETLPTVITGKSEAIYDTKGKALEAADKAIEEAEQKQLTGSKTTDFEVTKSADYMNVTVQVQIGTERKQTGTRVIKEAGWY